MSISQEESNGHYGLEQQLWSWTNGHSKISFPSCENVSKLYTLAKTQLPYLKMRKIVLNSQDIMKTNKPCDVICYALSIMPSIQQVLNKYWLFLVITITQTLVILPWTYPAQILCNSGFLQSSSRCCCEKKHKDVIIILTVTLFR